YTQKAHAARSATLSRSPELERLADAVLPPLKPGVVTAVFQPIVDLGGLRHQVVAVEALARGPKGTILESPSALFNVARRTNCVTQLDRACIAAAFDDARKLPEHLDIFINVHPRTLCDDCGFPAFLADAAAQAGIA